jgi:hypothetical protein
MRKSTPLTALTAALLLFLTCTTDAAKQAHLFILSGQSNMQGLKPESGFLPEARKLLPDAEIVHLKVAKGGQPIRFWVAEWDAIARDAGLEQPNPEGAVFYDAILAGLKPILARHPRPASVSFCWMQGERDAKSGMEAAYEPALKRLIANLRRDLKRPDLNVVIGRISDHDPGEKWRAGWEAVRKIHVKVATDDPRGAWVDTDDVNNKTRKGEPHDDLHYTEDGYRLFGQRLARQAVRLIEGKKPAADGRPE